jgi:hypothetical protein
LFNGKQEKLDEIICLEIFVYSTPPKSSHSLSVSGRARPWQAATTAQEPKNRITRRRRKRKFLQRADSNIQHVRVSFS